MRSRLLVTVCLLLALVPQLARSAEPQYPVATGPHAVGVRTVVFVDESRNDSLTGKPRTLVTDIWYPATEEARGKKPTTFTEFFGAHPEVAALFVNYFGGKIDEVEKRFKSIAVRGAPLEKGKYPLLIFSHGNGGVRHQNAFQMDHLASHGYIVASPDHTGNAGVTVLPDRVVRHDPKERKRSALERPQDVKFLIDRLLAESQKKESWLFETIDADSVGVLGHSFGGLTSCQAAARDPRVKAVLPMTVAISETLSTPLLVMIGEKDRTVGEAGNIVNRVSFAGAAGPKYLLSLKRGGHFSFSEMDVINPAFGDGIGTETRKGQKIEYLDSALTREIIDAYSLAFFDFYLRKDSRAGEYLKTNHYPAEMDLVSEPARR